MALLNSDENVQKLIEAEVTPLTKSASAGQRDRHPQREAERAAQQDAPAIVLPPDTGYDLEMADALLRRRWRPCSAATVARRTPSPRSTRSSAADRSTH